jgi:hypothetical protein
MQGLSVIKAMGLIYMLKTKIDYFSNTQTS